MPTDSLLCERYVRFSLSEYVQNEITSQVEWKDVNWRKAELAIFKLRASDLSRFTTWRCSNSSTTPKESSPILVCEINRRASGDSGQ